MQVAGAEMLVSEIVRRAGDLLEPTIFCLDGVGPLGEQLLEDGYEVIDLGRRPGRDYRVSWRMKKLIQERRIEIVHAHQYTPFFYAALAKMALGGSFRLILTEHGRHFPDLVSSRRRLVNRWLLGAQADAITGVCQFSLDGLIRNDGFPRNKARVIENGIVLERYTTARDREAVLRRLGLDPSRRYIGSIARFHPVKDHAMLLNAFARVAAAQDDADLMLVGDGALRGTLMELARSLKVESRVHFLGIRSDVPEVLQTLDAFALTSLSEAASLTLLEAMASRVPVVVTQVGGNPELVRDGIDGLHVPRGDAEATARALLRILRDPVSAASMGNSARRRVSDRYQLKNSISQYVELYGRLLGSRSETKGQ
jgi:glycosyltransferase involved in cell wall biosynthesis